MTIDEELAEIEAAEKAATLATSSRWVCGTPRNDGTTQVYSPSLGPARMNVPVAETTAEFGVFIAAARNALPKLIAEVRLLRETLVRARPSNAAASAARAHVLRPDRALGQP